MRQSGTYELQEQILRSIRRYRGVIHLGNSESTTGVDDNWKYPWEKTASVHRIGWRKKNERLHTLYPSTKECQLLLVWLGAYLWIELQNDDYDQRRIGAIETVLQYTVKEGGK